MPRKKYDSKQLAKAARAYTARTQLPIVTEFAQIQGISRNRLYEVANRDPELKEALQMMIDKKEITLQKGAIAGKIPVAFAIFSLKQIGWRDQPKEEQDTKENDEKIERLIKAVDSVK